MRLAGDSPRTYVPVKPCALQKIEHFVGVNLRWLWIMKQKKINMRA
jgi:hypothetical protein